MQPIMRKIIRQGGIAVTLWAMMISPLQAFETKAEYAILMDYTTGAVLYDKNADQSMMPASMSKIMTAYMVFTALDEGRLHLDDRITVSENAWRKGGSKMFLELGEKVRVEDLLRGIIVQSGNDACIAIAEVLAGSEDAFAKQMSQKARELGLESTVFRNSSGWPDPEHRTTARDLARLVYATIRDFPQYYSYYAEKEFTHNGIRQHNRNPLLRKGQDGIDGLKTGHTEESGYGLAASAERSGRRLILITNGLSSKRQRAIESEKILEWGFRNFDNYLVYAADTPVVRTKSWMSEEKELPLVLEKDFLITLERKTWKGASLRIRYPSLVKAPLNAQEPIGILILEDAAGNPIAERALRSGHALKPLSFMSRIRNVFDYLLWGTI